MKRQILLCAMSWALAAIAPAHADDLLLPDLHSPTPVVRPAPAGTPMVGRFAVIPAKRHDILTAASQAAAGATIPLWTRKVADGGTNFTYQMVGQDPFASLANGHTTIKAVVIPVKFVFKSFSNTSKDPTANDPVCSPKGTAEALSAASPLFHPIDGNIWGTDIGTGQYIDLFQRANYYTQTKTGGLNPDYHVTLSYSLSTKIVVNVTGGNLVKGSFCGSIGELDINSWDNYVQNTVFPALAAKSPKEAGPTTLPIFLFYNVVLTDNGCCILGYHSAFNDPAYGGAFHTYSIANFDTSTAFSGTADVSAFSHELGEWLDDPSGTNPTRAWGHIGQVSGCQSNLEVGDPLSGTLTQVYMASNKYTYHLQDMAFTSWFYHQKPSTGVNGWYSLLGTFLAPAPACP